MSSTLPPERRLGVLVPTGNSLHEQEFNRLRPTGLSFRFREFSYPPAGATFCDQLWHGLEQPSRDLAAWGAELVLIGCTTASMGCTDLGGQRRLEETVGVPILSAAQAVREAIAALQVHRLAVATPYGDANNRIVSHYLQSIGVGVSAIAGLGLDGSPESWATARGSLGKERLYGLAASLDSADTEALYLPCTGVASLEIIDRFERTTAKPALSSVQAGFWASLRRLGIDGSGSNAGRLVRLWSGV